MFGQFPNISQTFFAAGATQKNFTTCSGVAPTFFADMSPATNARK
jgi:hypothetical protein